MNSISTFSLSELLRANISELQVRLGRAQTEQTTGRKADLSVGLGGTLAVDYQLRSSLVDLQSYSATNTAVKQRLDSTQAALTAIVKDAKDIRAAAVAVQTDKNSASTLVMKAKDALASFTTLLNTSDGSGYVFGGAKIDQPPAFDYNGSNANQSGYASTKAFVDAQLTSYLSSVGVSSVNALSANQLTAFVTSLSNVFSSQSGWSSYWSGASDVPMTSRISPVKTIATSVTANDPALQKVAMGYVILSGISLENMNQNTYEKAVSVAVDYLDSGLAGLNDMQTRAGVMQQENESSTSENSAAILLVKEHIGELEDVDPTELAVRINNLTTQVQAAYSLTSRLQNLSLVKYL